MNVITIVIGSIAAFFSVISIGSVYYAMSSSNKEDIWLFSDWINKVYNSLFEDKKPEKIADALGIDATKIIHTCSLIGAANNIKPIIIYRLLGIIAMFLGFVFGVFLNAWLFTIIFVLISMLLCFLPSKMLVSKLERKKLKMELELPRFLDMLHTALLVDMPIDIAIKETAECLSELTISKELLNSLVDVQIGASSWQDALEKLAKDYEIDDISNFVLDIVTTYKNGTSIVESVERQSKDIKASNLLSAKERAGKLTNIILFPILGFKIIPFVIFLSIPIVMQLNGSGFIS